MARTPLSNVFKRWQLISIIVGVLAAVVTICRFGIPPIVDLAMHDRDKEVTELRTEIRELRALVAQSVDATQQRFEANEKHTGYLREAVAAIRAELRVRFNSPDKVSIRTDHAISNSSSVSRTDLPSLPTVGVYRPPTPVSLDELNSLAARTDRSVEESNRTIPQGKPLEKVQLF
jgi:hypothetical protein